MRLLIFFCLTFLSLSVLSKELNLLCKSNLNPDNHFFIELDINKNYVNVIIPFVSEENDMYFLSHLKALGLDVNDFTKSELANVTETLLEIKYNIHLEKILDKGLQLAFPETMLREFTQTKENLLNLKSTGKIKFDEDGFGHFGNLLIYRDTGKTMISATFDDAKQILLFNCQINKKLF